MPSFGERAGLEDARSLLAWLVAFGAWWDEAAKSEGWLPDFYRLLLGVVASENAVRAGLRNLCAEWTSLIKENRDYILRGIEFSGVGPGDAPFDAAVDALASGRRPFGLLPIGKTRLRSVIDGVRIDGRAPGNAQDWHTVRDQTLAKACAHVHRSMVVSRSCCRPSTIPQWMGGRKSGLSSRRATY